LAEITRKKIRDSVWFQKTWMEYIKKDYRAALHRWSKDTGGGDGSSQSFQDYCGTRTWIGWVYLLDEENGFLLASNCKSSVPENLRNESGVESKSTGKKGRMESALDDMMKEYKEGQKNKAELAGQLLSRFDAIATTISNIPKSNEATLFAEHIRIVDARFDAMAINNSDVPKLNETDTLFAEHSRIVNAEKQITMDMSMSASMKTHMLEVLNFQREELDAKFVALANKKKRKASELSGTSS
jgi:hypothetical protein